MGKEEIIISTLNHLLEEMNILKENLSFNKSTFNVKDFSAYSGIKESYIYKIVGQELINFSKPNGKMLFFKKLDVDDYLLQNPVKAKSTIEKEALEFSQRK